MYLKDNRHLDHKDSIIRAIQARLNNGPVYSQYSSIVIVRLKDAEILDLIIRDVKTCRFRFKEGTSLLSIIISVRSKAL